MNRRPADHGAGLRVLASGSVIETWMVRFALVESSRTRSTNCGLPSLLIVASTPSEFPAEHGQQLVVEYLASHIRRPTVSHFGPHRQSTMNGMTRYAAFFARASTSAASTSRWAEVAEAFEEAGFTNVRTILASGNVALESRSGVDAVEGRRRKRRLRDAFGYDAWVLGLRE